MAKSRRNNSGERGAIIIIAVAFFAAFMFILALAADGFVLIESRAMLQHSCEYAAEAALRSYRRTLAATSNETTAKETAAARLLEVLNRSRIVTGRWDPVVSTEITVDSPALGVAGRLNFGAWNGTFSPDADTAAPNDAVQVDMIQPQGGLFFATVTGLRSVNVRASVTVFAAPAGDGLYEYRAVR